MFDEAPYRLPFPPNVGPNAKAKAIGCTGRLRVWFSASETTIFTIIAVTGIESTTDDVKADTLIVFTKRLYYVLKSGEQISSIKYICHLNQFTHKTMTIARAKR